jgi:2,4-diketo-3-deoxy-L-fuconate hydrolase
MRLNLAYSNGRASLIRGELLVDAELVAFPSRHCTLAPDDLTFTGTPAGVGSIRRRYLQPSDLIESTLEGIGSLRNRCVSA